MLQKAIIIAQQRRKFQTGRLLDLDIRLGAQSITDLSAYGNNATLKSGIYFSTLAVGNDKGVGADCSASGSGDYYYTARIRDSATGTKYATIGGAAVSVNLPSADVWTDVTFSNAVGVTPSACFFGWDGGTNFSDCDWSEVKLWQVGVPDPVGYWPGYDSEAAELNGRFVADISGNEYNGAHVNCSSGSGATDILQTAGLNWNVYRYFNGVDSNVSLTSAITLSGDFSIVFKIIPSTDVGGTQVYFGHSSLNHRIGRTGTNLGLVQINGSTYIFEQVSVPSNAPQLITVTRSGSSVTFESDAQSQTKTINTADFVLDIIGGHYNGSYVNGLCYAVDINASAAYSGLGDTPWADTLGSNDGTESGTFEDHLIPQLASDPSLDATGQPIDKPRLNDKVLNLASSSLSAQVAADASMDLTQTVYAWVDYDGTDGNFFDLGTPVIGATAGVLTSTLAGTLTYYVNGVATTTLGTAGWKFIAIASDTAQATDAIDILRTSAALRFSERELSAAEVQARFNSSKSQYGF